MILNLRLQFFVSLTAAKQMSVGCCANDSKFAPKIFRNFMSESSSGHSGSIAPLMLSSSVLFCCVRSPVF
jgi:hypothetical protein